MCNMLLLYRENSNSSSKTAGFLKVTIRAGPFGLGNFDLRFKSDIAPEVPKPCEDFPWGLP